MYIQTIEEIPSTCFILRFNNIKDYYRMERELTSSFFIYLPEFDLFHESVDLLEIDVELADSYIKDFICYLSQNSGIELTDSFIMTTDLTKDPEYTFTANWQVIENKNNKSLENADEVER